MLRDLKERLAHRMVDEMLAKGDSGSAAHLQGLLTVTRHFSERFWKDKDPTTATKDYLLHMMSEIDEVLRELNWKLHRPGFRPTVRTNLLEELIDLYKYWLCIVALWGFSPEEIMETFWRKTAVVEQRWLQEQALANTTQPMVLIDIDGVLADYPASFVAYVTTQTGQEAFAKVDSYENLIEGMARIDVVRWKQRYREEGFEGGQVDPMAEAAAFMARVGRTGYFRCVVTARPYHQYKRMFADTLSWFHKNGIPFEAIVFHEDKQTFALQLIDAGKQISWAVEDHPGQARALAALGVKVFLLTRPYNKDANFDDLPITRVNSLQEVL